MITYWEVSNCKNILYMQICNKLMIVMCFTITNKEGEMKGYEKKVIF